MTLLRRIAAALCIARISTALRTPITAISSNVSSKNDFQSFGKALGLSDIVTSSLADQYTKANSPIEIARIACLMAQASLGEGQVDIPPFNGSAVEENWSQTCVNEPACIVQPTNASGVSIIIRLVGFLEVKFSVRSGGHSPNPGYSSVGQDGLLLSLGELNAVTLSEDRSFATIDSGARWGAVYDVLDRENAVVLGARLSSVGSGGSLLGGGYSFLANGYGLAADKVKNFEVVLGNGAVVNANAEENVALFWALKGGGPNFGVVTKYQLYTVPVSTIWVKVIAFSPDQAIELLTAYDSWQKNGSSDTKSNVVLTIGLDSITLGLIYSEAVNETPSVFSPFSELGSLSVILGPTNTSIGSLTNTISAVIPNTQIRHDYRGCSSRVDTNLTQQVYTFWREKALSVRNSTGANQTFVVQHIGESFNRQGTESDGNPLNIPSGDQQWWTTLIDWEHETDDDLVRSVSIETCAFWETQGRRRGSYVPFIYMNDASRDQNPLASYGDESLAKLKVISKEYDPLLVFQNLQNDGFLLSRV